jgi:hypothetical protein
VSKQTSEISSRGFAFAAVVFFLIACAAWSAATQNFGSAWIKTGALHGANSLLGYSETELANVVHKENRSFLQQIAMFSGATTDVVDKFYMVRPSYAYTAAFLAPFFGLKGAGLVLNILAWAVAAWCAWSLAIRLFGERLAGLLSVMFVAAGMGFVVHIGDISAHLLSFTTYYLGIVVLERSEIWKETRDRRVHLAIGAFIALCSLTYNTGLALLLAYIVLSLRHNRWTDVVFASAIALSAQYAWIAVLNIGYAVKTGEWAWYNLYANEGDYLRESLRRWMSAWSHPTEGAGTTLRIILEFLCFEFPLSVVAGLAAAAVQSRFDPRRWLALFILFAAPIAGAMAYAQTALARGYLVFGISLISYVALGGMLARALRITGGRRVVATAVIVVLLGGQIGWSGAAFVGQLGPLRTYFLGFEAGAPELASHAVSAVSLTGDEPQPAWFGGAAPFEALGIYQGGGPVATTSGYTHRLAVSLGSRALVTGYLILLLSLSAVLWNWNVRRTVAGVVIFIYLLPSVVMAAVVRNSIQFVSIDNAGPGPGCGGMQYSVRLSQDFRHRLMTLAGGGARLDLFFRPADDALGQQNVEFFVGDQRLDVEPMPEAGRWIVTTADWPALLAKDDVTVRVVYRDEKGVRYLGWQRVGLPDRSLHLEGCDQTASALPALELRAVTAKGAAVLVGF